MRSRTFAGRSRRAALLPLSLLALASCTDTIEIEPWLPPDSVDEEEVPLDDRTVTVAAVPPPPITGGTLTVVGDVAVASDPDRDLIYLVDLQDFSLRRSISLAPGSWPGRVVADGEGLTHVVLRGTGRVISFDPADGVVVHDRAVCATPRGIDVRAADGAVIVACAAGQLLALPADGGSAETIATLEPDLRDVIVRDDGRIEISRFRAASVLSLDPDAVHVDVTVPTGWRAKTTSSDFHPMEPHTAWRTVGTSDGGWVMVHQAASTQAIEGVVGARTQSSGYGGGSHGCEAIVQSGVTRYSPADGWTSSGPLSNVVLPVDLAASEDGAWLGVVSAATSPGRGNLAVVLISLDQLRAFDEGDELDCQEPIPVELPEGDAQAIAVAFDGTARLLVQTREPARLFRIEHYDLSRVDTVELSDRTRFDSGHQQFHEDPGSGVACASCHPEGGDDGHVWSFAELGLRHTPSLDVGLRDTEPFHWTGELEDFTALVDEVFVLRMGAMMPTPERKAALEGWLYSLHHPRVTILDAAAVRGAAVWDALACGSCHAGAALTNNEWSRIGPGDPLQVPSLRAVALHPPYMHDGRSPDLDAAVREMIGVSGEATAAAPTDEQIADLIAYLGTF